MIKAADKKKQQQQQQQNKTKQRIKERHIYCSLQNPLILSTCSYFCVG